MPRGVEIAEALSVEGLAIRGSLDIVARGRECPVCDICIESGLSEALEARRDAEVSEESFSGLAEERRRGVGMRDCVALRVRRLRPGLGAGIRLVPCTMMR